MALVGGNGGLPADGVREFLGTAIFGSLRELPIGIFPLGTGRSWDTTSGAGCNTGNAGKLPLCGGGGATELDAVGGMGVSIAVSDPDARGSFCSGLLVVGGSCVIDAGAGTGISIELIVVTVL